MIQQKQQQQQYDTPSSEGFPGIIMLVVRWSGQNSAAGRGYRNTFITRTALLYIHLLLCNSDFISKCYVPPAGAQSYR